MSGVAINRWIMRRQRKILLYSTSIFFMMIIYISVFQKDIKIRETHYQPFSEKCLYDSASKFINSVCSNFSKDLAFGNFCQDLCIDKSVAVDNCIHHGSTYVFMGHSKGDAIVMKKKKMGPIHFSIQLFEEVARDPSIYHVRDAYISRLKEEVKATLGNDNLRLFMKSINMISYHIFGMNISDVSLAQLRASWQAVGQDELNMMLIHQKLESFPKFIGVCGPLYVIERTKPYSEYFPEILPSLSWEKRVKIAKGFLNLLTEFQATEIGPLFHCDIQEANFGLTNEYNVKAIDVDLVYANNKMEELLSGSDCTTNQDCEFFDCLSKCNIAKKRCTTTRLTNNLQVVCRDIFLPQWPMNGLLSYFQPAHVKKKLNSLLEMCRSKRFGSLSMNHVTVVNMKNELELTLDLSLLTNYSGVY